MKLTDVQRRALAYLATVDHARPSNIGWALAGDAVALQRSLRSLGRTGALVATNLRAKGLVGMTFPDYTTGTWYCILSAGRAALAEIEAAETNPEGTVE